jgi:hypothetical protein
MKRNPRDKATEEKNGLFRVLLWRKRLNTLPTQSTARATTVELLPLKETELI